MSSDKQPRNAAPDGPAPRGGGNFPPTSPQPSDQVHNSAYDEALAAGGQAGERATERRAPTSEERVTEEVPQTDAEIGHEAAGSPDDGMAGNRTRQKS